MRTKRNVSRIAMKILLVTAMMTFPYLNIGKQFDELTKIVDYGEQTVLAFCWYIFLSM